MKISKLEPKYIKKDNPRIGLITLASDFRIEKDFNNIIYGRDIDLYSNRINCYNPLTNETLKKMADDIPEVHPYATQSSFWYGKISLVTSVISSAIFFKVSFVSGL